MTMQFGRRREAVDAPPASDAGHPQLVELLRAEIERDGPLTFARFMQRALYEPGLGYYATSAERPSRSGDYLTAPELHPLFGHVIARQLHEMWQLLAEPDEFVLREYGAGRGVLASAAVDGLARIDSGLAAVLAYQPVDLAGQLDALGQSAGLADALQRGAKAELPATGCILANEFLDALPVHRVLVESGRLRELYVGWHAGRFVEISGEPSSSKLVRWFEDAGVELADGQRGEVNLAMLEWLTDVAGDLKRGYIVLVDYGAPAAELYGPVRRDGTLRAFRNQHLSRDVLAGAGRQDLTATVDLDALERGARAAGFSVLGHISLAHFLLGAGLEDALAEAKARLSDDVADHLLLRSAVARLIDPRALGAYAVVVLGKGVRSEPTLRGLAYRPPTPA